MVVVTSPMGDHAPPALALMITAPAKSHRVGLSAINFRSKEIITIEVVRLSKAAEKKKVTSLEDESIPKKWKKYYKISGMDNGDGITELLLMVVHFILR